MAAANPATTCTFQAGGRREDNSGEKGVSLAESLILLRGFPVSLTIFFLHLINQPLVKQPSLSRGRGWGWGLGNVLLWLIALPAKSGSTVKRARRDIGYMSSSFIASTSSYKRNCWIKSSYTLNILIVPNCPLKEFDHLHFCNTQEGLLPHCMAHRLCQTHNVLLS